MAFCRALRLAAIAAALLGLAPPQNAEARILAQWVELGPDGNSSVRAITEDACPSVSFDGKPIPMSVRSEPGRSFGNVKPYVSGHIHFFQAVDFGGVRPPQLVVGTGGDNLAALPPLSVIGTDINGAKVVDSVTYSGFGYMVWDRAGSAWSGTLFDANGRPINHCRLANRTLSCSS